jgi:hypothetical protein
LQHIVHYFWQLCLFRRHPAELPGGHSNLLVIGLIYGLIVVSASALSYPSRSLITSLSMVVVGLAIQVVLIFFLMWFKGFVDRTVAVIGNLLGASALMTCLLLPINLILLQGSPGLVVSIADALTWLWLGWWLCISGYVLARSINISIVQGAFIAFLIELLSVLTSFSLFSEL